MRSLRNLQTADAITPAALKHSEYEFHRFESRIATSNFVYVFALAACIVFWFELVSFCGPSGTNRVSDQVDIASALVAESRVHKYI